MLRIRYLLALGITSFVIGTLVAVAHATVDPLDHIIFRNYPHSGVMLAGKILDGSGNRLSGVRVTVVSTPLAGGSSSTYIGISGPRGSYGVFVPPGPSRIFSVFAAGESSKVKELVRPGLWLTITPQRNGRVLFTGGIKVGRSGSLPTVLLQDRTPRSWQTFGAVSPNVHSHLWRFHYRAMHQIIGLRFKFRITTLPNSAWLSGYSNVKTAVIR